MSRKFASRRHLLLFLAAHSAPPTFGFAVPGIAGGVARLGRLADPKFAGGRRPRSVPERRGGRRPLFGDPRSIPRGGAAGSFAVDRSASFLGMTDGEDEESDASSEESASSSDGEDEESDESVDDADPAEAEVVSTPFESRVGASAPDDDDVEDAAREQQRRSYFLSAVLWLSLALDSILNGRKRSAVFGTAGTDRLLNLGPAAELSSGFAAAAGAAYLISRKMSPSHDDSGASSSSRESADEAADFADAARRRLHLVLAAFGATNMAAHANASSAPFLGMSALFINGHNALIALNGWRKDIGAGASWTSELANGAKTFARGLLIGSEDRTDGDASRSFISACYLGAALVSVVRLIKLGTELVPGVMGVTTATMAREVALKWASLARLILASGVAVTLKEATDKSQLGRPLIVGLNGIASACSLFVAVSISISSHFDFATTLVSKDAILLALFASVSGYNYLKFAMANKK